MAHHQGRPEHVEEDESAVRRALRLERDDALSQLRALDAEFEAIVSGSVDGNGDDEHDPEGPTVAFERSRVSALAARATQRIEAVEIAWARLELGTYRWCVGCGSDIGVERLAARPTTTVCMACASGGWLIGRVRPMGVPGMFR